MRQLAQRRNLMRAVDRAGFARLRERQRRCIHLMRPMSGIAFDCRAHRVDDELAADAGQPDELEAAAEELRRAAFVGDDVGFGVAQHAAPGRRDMRERQRIGGGAGRHDEDRNLALEDLAKPALDALCCIVIAIAERETGVGRENRVKDFRSDSRGVVAGKVHALPRPKAASCNDRRGENRNIAMQHCRPNISGPMRALPPPTAKCRPPDAVAICKAVAPEDASWSSCCVAVGEPEQLYRTALFPIGEPLPPWLKFGMVL